MNHVLTNYILMNNLIIRFSSVCRNSGIVSWASFMMNRGMYAYWSEFLQISNRQRSLVNNGIESMDWICGVRYGAERLDA